MNTKQQILYHLSQTSDYLSGTHLATVCNVSRNAIWKAINTLKSEGFSIESHPSKGYQLTHSPETLNQAQLASYFPSMTVFTYESIDSTNTQAKMYADKLETRYALFVSTQQTNGRGRFGRTFHSPKDTGVYMSLLCKAQHLQSHLHLITPLSAVAVLRAMQTVIGITPAIKWVNDLFHNQKKVCGILTEAVTNVELGTIDHIVIGIGTNIYKDHTLPAELESIVGYLTDHQININLFVKTVVEELITLLENLPDISFLDTYRQHCFILGQDIIVAPHTQQTYIAKALNISDNGHLIVQDAQGTTHTLQHGEVSVKPTH